MPTGVTGGMGLRPNSSVSALAVYDDGDGDALFVGGGFQFAGPHEVSSIAKWNGMSWTPLLSGVNGSVSALEVYDDGSGEALYVGGSFSTAGGINAANIAKWDGSEWTSLGTGVNSGISALRVYNDGSGPALYAAGNFIAKWDGVSWTSLGSGVSGNIYDLVVYDDGNGPALYAGGDFSSVDGVAANDIARWDGAAWSVVNNSLNPWILDMEVHDDGTGSALYVTGGFGSRTVKWDGTTWQNIGIGAGILGNALTVHDDGYGAMLYAGGYFTNAAATGDNGLAGNRIIRWTGSGWSALDQGVNAAIGVLASYDDGNGAALYVGGPFGAAGGIASTGLGKYSCPPGLSILSPINMVSGETAPFQVHLDAYNAPVASVVFSIDYDSDCLDPDVDEDGTLDNIVSFVPGDFNVTTFFDSADPDGEIDVYIADLAPPFSTLPGGELLMIDFQASCSTIAPTISRDVQIPFSLDPPVSFGSDQGRSIRGVSRDGTVRIWSGNRGDCNADDIVDAGDLPAIVLEIFDADGDDMFDVPGSTFPGSPVGCDANTSTLISAADVTCAGSLLFGGICAAEPLGDFAPDLKVDTHLETGIVWISVALADGTSRVGSFALSLDLDPERFNLSGIDGDGDGAPDFLRFPTGGLDLPYVAFDISDTDGELDILIAALSERALPEGVLMEIGVPMNSIPIGGLTVSTDPSLSLGTPMGGDLNGSAILLPIFADGFETGDLNSWSSRTD